MSRVSEKRVSEAAQEEVTEKTTGIAAQEEKERCYVIKVRDNPEYCGIGAGGVQFANGTAKTNSSRMAEWFREHKGYIVE